MFIANLGQFDPSLRYMARIGPDAVGVEEHALILWHPRSADEGSLVRLNFATPSPSSSIQALEPELGVYSYFFGDEPAKWVHQAPSFARVRFHEAWPGVDLDLHEEAGVLKYDVLVAAGADLGRVVFEVQGASVSSYQDGRVEIDTPDNNALWQYAGKSWQAGPEGAKQEIAVRARLLDEHRFGFEARERDLARALVIDPSLASSTYLGSVGPHALGSGDGAAAVATADNGDVTAVGAVDYINFPTTPGSYQHPGARYGATFVTHLRGSDGALLYSSLIGGIGVHGIPAAQGATSVAIDAQGRSVVAGATSTRNFPTTPGAFDTHFSSFNFAGFVLRLSTIGDLEFSTFLQADNEFDIVAVAVDPRSGSIFVAGTACCTGLPVSAASFQAGPNAGSTDGYVAKLDPSGSSVDWGTWIGGSSIEDLFAMAVDERGRVAITGRTFSHDYPVTPGAYRTQSGTGGYPEEAFVTVIAPRGDHLIWSSYFGSTTAQEATNGRGIAFDPQGGIVIAGVYGAETFATQHTFPTTPGAWQATWAGGPDGFVARFLPNGSGLVYSTLFGGPLDQQAYSLSIDRSGVATIAGDTNNQLPTTPGCYDTTWNGGVPDCFIARFNPSGTKLLYSTYVGGADEDHMKGLSISPADRTTIAGYTYSHNWPTTPGAIASTYVGGQTDAFVTSLDLVLQGIDLLGNSTGACKGLLHLNALEKPSAGDATFGFYLSQAPASSSGVLLVGAPASQATHQYGIALWLDPTQPITEIPFITDHDGYAEIPFSLATYLQGASFAVQARVLDTDSCGGLGNASGSQAVVVTVQ